MLCVVIQPYSYDTISELSDIKSISVIKFAKRALGEEDYYFDELYNGELTKDAAKIIFDNVCDDNVITYSGILLYRTLHAISNECPEYAFDASKIIGLMEEYAEIYPSRKKWHKLTEALSNYGYDVILDRDDPVDMTKNTLVLYRFMQKDPRVKEKMCI